MAQQGFAFQSESQAKIDILAHWCAANEIVIHPDLQIVLNSAHSTRATRRTRVTLTAPLVDYYDDDNNDEESDEYNAMNERAMHDHGPRRGSLSASDHTIPGMAVFAQSFIECGTTVVQIPPRAVLSYPNVFGITLTNCDRQIPRWPVSAADPTTIADTQMRESPGPLITANERSGVYRPSFSHGGAAESLPLVNNDSNIDQSSIDPSLALSLALLNELTKGEASRWWGYLQSLPTEEPSLAIFWDESDPCAIDMLDAGCAAVGVDREHARRNLHRQARRRIAGTQLERYLQTPAMQKQMMVIRTFFTWVVDPFLRALEYEASSVFHQRMSGLTSPSRWALFRRAYTLVSSRAFWVDAYHGLALVPIADVFNHTEEHHVHLETDWEVCRICGALNSCPHDADDPDLVGQDDEISSMSKFDPVPHSYDMVCDRTINGGSEVFNTYNVEPRSQAGAGTSGGIPNVELMCRYGFVLEGNGADRLLFDEEEIQQASAGHPPTGMPPIKGMNGEWAVRGVGEIHALFVDAGLILLENSEVDGLEMDAEGSISTGLWIRLANQARFHTGANGELDGTSINGEVATALVQGLCTGVVGLCEGRLRMMGDDENNDEEGTRQAEGLLAVVGRYVRGERALLNAAVQLWKTFRDSGVLEDSER